MGKATTYEFSKMNIKDYLNRQPKSIIIIIAVVMLCLVGLSDYATGYEYAFSLFYLLPIIFVSWFESKKVGILFSLISSLIIFVADYFAGRSIMPTFVEIWNFAIHLGFFVIFSLLIASLKNEIDEHRMLNVALKDSLNEIKLLSGMLPICASCKKIRDDNGYWKQIETYISEHSEAQFSHSICPDCMEKLYPEIYRKMAKNQNSLE
jgi:hypothetical protein